MSKKMWFRLVAAAAFAVLSLACRPSQTVEQQTRDAAIEAQVKAKLASDVGAASVTAVEVNVTNGVVTLAGPVSTEDDRQRAEAAARGVEGVTSVNNNLQVTTTGVAPPAGATMAPPGTALTPGTPPMATTPLGMGTTPPSQPESAMTPKMAMPPPTPAAGAAATPTSGIPAMEATPGR